MKFGIDMGHNVRPDSGATGVRQEDDVIKEVGTRVTEKLKRLGHTVIVCTPQKATSVGNSLYQRVKTANDNNVDIFVSIHFNAGGGRGTEVFAASTKGKEIAQKVLKEIVALGFVNRGVKDGSWIYVVRNAKAPAILIECAFVDSRDDMAKFNPEDMSVAIVKGLTGQNTGTVDSGNITPTQPTEPSTPQPSIPSVNSEVKKMQNMLNKLKVTDFEGHLIQEDGVFGAKTRSAIEKFQSMVGINVDGLVGTYTMSLIDFILSKPTLSIKYANPTATRYLQWRLGITVDGVFGNNTRNAVFIFQKNNRLIIDGIVGPSSWKTLVG